MWKLYGIILRKEVIKNMLDGELVKKAKKGDELAIKKIIEQTEKKAFFVAISSLRNSATASDIVQETYIKAFSDIHKLKDNSKFESWFNTILNRKIIDYIRSHHHTNEKASVNFSFFETEENEFNFEDSIRNEYEDWQPEEHVNTLEIQEGVQRILGELPEMQRLAIVQYYFNEQSTKEIALEQNVSINTVKGWLNYGRRRIKDYIEDLRQKDMSFYGVVPLQLLKFCFDSEASNISISSSLSADTILSQISIGSTGIGGITAWWAAKSAVAKTAITASAVTVGGIGAYQIPEVQNFIQQHIIDQINMQMMTDMQLQQMQEQQRIIDEQTRLQQEEQQRIIDEQTRLHQEEQQRIQLEQQNQYIQQQQLEQQNQQMQQQFQQQQLQNQMFQ